MLTMSQAGKRWGQNMLKMLIAYPFAGSASDEPKSWSEWPVKVSKPKTMESRAHTVSHTHTDSYTHTHLCVGAANRASCLCSVVLRARAYVTNMRRRHRRVAAAHPPLLPRTLYLFPCCPIRCESTRVAIVVASQAVISPCLWMSTTLFPNRIVGRVGSVCSMKLVTSIFVVDVVVVVVVVACHRRHRPHTAPAPGRIICCCRRPLPVAPLRSVACLPAWALSQCIPLVVGQFTSSNWAGTAGHGRAHAIPGTGDMLSSRSADCCPILPV